MPSSGVGQTVLLVSYTSALRVREAGCFRPRQRSSSDCGEGQPHPCFHTLILCLYPLGLELCPLPAVTGFRRPVTGQRIPASASVPPLPLREHRHAMIRAQAAPLSVEILRQPASKCPRPAFSPPERSLGFGIPMSFPFEARFPLVAAERQVKRGSASMEIATGKRRRKRNGIRKNDPPLPQRCDRGWVYMPYLLAINDRRVIRVPAPYTRRRRECCSHSELLPRCGRRDKTRNRKGTIALQAGIYSGMQSARHGQAPPFEYSENSQPKRSTIMLSISSARNARSTIFCRISSSDSGVMSERWMR